MNKNPSGSGNILVEIDHELFSTVILFLRLIQEGRLSVFRAVSILVLSLFSGLFKISTNLEALSQHD